MHFEIITGTKLPADTIMKFLAVFPPLLSLNMYGMESLVCTETGRNIMPKYQLGNTQ